MGQSGAGFGPSMPLMPQGLPSFPVAGGDEMRGLHSPHPPAYSSPPVQAPPPSGYRIPLTTDAPFPPANLTLRAPFTDADGRAPVFFGSALFPNAVHPCKIAPHLTPPCRVPYAGQEWEHHGRYDLLPYAPDTMELVQTSGGRIPLGRRPVEGGYEETGQKLYHAVAMVNGLRVPGKAGEHLVKFVPSFAKILALRLLFFFTSTVVT